MAKELTDDELNLRRKARRRLIGAIALTLAVVVVLPMVLDSEPKSTGKDIDLRIPAPDKVGEFVPRVAVSDVAVTLPLASSAVVVGPAPDEAVPAVVVSAVTHDEAKPKPTASPSEQKQAVPSKAMSGSNQPSESTKSAETRSADKPAGADGYVAQVGAYSNSSTAKQELKKLKEWGFKAYTEKSDGKIRVRVGPYPDRDKAEKVGKLLEKHGLHPVILSDK